MLWQLNSMRNEVRIVQVNSSPLGPMVVVCHQSNTHRPANYAGINPAIHVRVRVAVWVIVPLPPDRITEPFTDIVNVG
jgi:hypothetical protein